MQFKIYFEKFIQKFIFIIFPKKCNSISFSVFWITFFHKCKHFKTLFLSLHYKEKKTQSAKSHCNYFSFSFFRMGLIELQVILTVPYRGRSTANGGLWNRTTKIKNHFNTFIFKLIFLRINYFTKYKLFWLYLSLELLINQFNYLYNNFKTKK